MTITVIQHTPEQQTAIDAYVLATRDNELDAWNAMYDALYPRPVSTDKWNNMLSPFTTGR